MRSKYLNCFMLFSTFALLFSLLLAGCDMGALKYFTVSFAADGGVPEPVAQKVQKGGLIVEPEEMAKKGHDFGSWYRDASCTVLWDFGLDVVDQDITLYAKWEPSENKASSGGGGGGSSVGGGGGAHAQISVTVDPATVTVGKGGTWQFSAVVNNSSDQRVSWSVSGSLSGIDSNGLLSVHLNETIGAQLTVTATSVADNTKSGTALVTVAVVGALSGAVSIGGNNWAGETLTANTSLLGGSGAISYQWERGGVDIPGQTGPSFVVAVSDQGQTITVRVSRADNSGTVTSAWRVIVPVPLTITVGSQSRPLTPIEDSLYSERSATFTVTVSGYLEPADAAGIGLSISTVNGLTFSNFAAQSGFAGRTQTFNVGVLYDGIEPFSSGSQTITITSLTGSLANYSYTAGSTTLYIYDGQVDYTGAGTDRRIPVNDNNIGAFNFYANTTNGLLRHYKLVESVTLDPPVLPATSNWTAIGDFSNQFTGSFDGQRNTIDDLTINKPSDSDQGLFGYVGTTGVVRNVGLIGGSIKGYQGIGGVVGTNQGTVQNCYATGDVTGTANVGGVVGYITSTGTIQNCYATGNVSGELYFGDIFWWALGGVVGLNVGTLQNCYATGNISGDSFGLGDQVGGVVGANIGTVKNCYSTGNVSGGTHAGGVVGDIYDFVLLLPDAVLQNCVALSKNVTATSSDVGRVWSTSGITSSISNNYARSDMAAGGIPFSGGPYTDHTHQDGADITPASVPPTIAELDAFWTDTSKWDASSPWDFANMWNRASGSRLPTLRNMPAGVQDPVIP